MKTALLHFFAFLAAAAIWLSCLHLFFRPDPRDVRPGEGISSLAHRLSSRHLAIWSSPELRTLELRKMQERNPEWDFMSRTFFVLSLANMALVDPGFRDKACEIIDAIVENTLTIEKEKGAEYFLLSYARTSGKWRLNPPQCQFVDGEIALMLAARCFVKQRVQFKQLLYDRVNRIVSGIRKSPVLCVESYPNECWMFDNSLSLAAIRMADVLNGTDHGDFLAEWIRTAKTKLLHRPTGLLIATFTVNGTPAPAGNCPEGSTIWGASHMLQIVDREFAEDQYRRAKAELSSSFFGFAYSREWTSGERISPDIDSGPIVPFFEASAGASGLAFIGSRAFGDYEFFSKLLTSLNFVGFPEENDGQLEYHASNPVGDAVLLYSLVLGSLWKEVERRGRDG